MKAKSIKKTLWFVIVFLLFVACSIVVLAAIDYRYRVIVTPDELTHILEESEYTSKEQTDMLVIDLRDTVDYQKEHIANSINIVYDDEGVKLLSYLKKHDFRTKNVYLICYSGKRSADAFNTLYKNNYKKLNYVRFGYEEYVSNLEGDTLLSAGKCKCEDEE